MFCIGENGWKISESLTQKIKTLEGNSNVKEVSIKQKKVRNKGRNI